MIIYSDLEVFVEAQENTRYLHIPNINTIQIQNMSAPDKVDLSSRKFGPDAQVFHFWYEY
jgi:hypothetical protein